MAQVSMKFTGINPEVLEELQRQFPWLWAFRREHWERVIAITPKRIQGIDHLYQELIGPGSLWTVMETPEERSAVYCIDEQPEKESDLRTYVRNLREPLMKYTEGTLEFLAREYVTIEDGQEISIITILKPPKKPLDWGLMLHDITWHLTQFSGDRVIQSYAELQS